MKYIIILIMFISFNLESNEIKIIQYKYKIGVSDNRHYHRVFAESVCDALNKAEENSCILINTEPSKNLIKMLNTDVLNVVFTQEDVAFNTPNNSSLKKLIITNKDTLNVIVPFNSTSSDISDLKSKKIVVARYESHLLLDARLSLLLNKWRFEDINQIKYVDNIKDGIDRLCKREFDAMIVVSANVHPMLAEQISRCDLKFIDTIGSDFFLTKRYPYYYKVHHNSHMYDSTLKDVDTIGVNSILLTNEFMSNEDASYFLNVFLEVLSNMKESNSNILLAYNTEIKYDIENNKTLPYHQGAISYYKSHFIID